jgi:hypothetical protein
MPCPPLFKPRTIVVDPTRIRRDLAQMEFRSFGQRTR